MQANNYIDSSAEQFCTFAFGNERDKSPDQVSTTSALIYFLTWPQRPTSETKCPEHHSPTQRIEFPQQTGGGLSSRCGTGYLTKGI